ncbi:glycosyltransferase family 2 protein [Solicola sp. PLA-1-18]|uniref:glycosyltransferase family 2 protein n=1 Tax=Solicola sp. PLA-1-18 TaxID=3380532 RepID=UPI003B777008
MTEIPVHALPGNRWDLLEGVLPDEAPRVSVVVVHHDQQRELDRCLAALERQTHPADRLEVVVADDGSPTPPRVPPGVRLMTQEDLGFRAAAARNLGLSAATGDVVCFLDADCAPEPQYVAAASRLPALAPDAVVVGRRRHATLDDVAVDAPVEAAGPVRELDEPAWLREAYRESADLLHADDRSYRFVIGATLTTSRTLLEAAGGFDESFTSYGGEDLEWAYRAWLHGAVLAHEPTAVVWHDGADWAERTDPAERRDRKLDETLRVASALPDPGARGRGLRYRRPDVLVRLAAGLDATAAVVTLDGLLAAVPDAVALVEPRVHDLVAEDARVVPVDDPLAVDALDLPDDLVTRHALTHVRLVLDAHAGLLLDPERLGREIETTHTSVGSRSWTSLAGNDLLTLTRLRAARRHRRWGVDDLFGDEVRASDSVTSLPPSVTVEGWFAGW